MKHLKHPLPQSAAPGIPQAGRPALLVIDVQQGLFEKSSPIYHAPELIRNLNDLIERAHLAGVPVIYIQHSSQKHLVKESREWQFYAKLHPPQAGDAIVHKLHGNAFKDTNLHALLQSLGVEQLVITGLLTNGCVQATCRGALEMGYPLTLVGDAHSTYSKPPDKVIRKLNEEMRSSQAAVLPAAEITFSA